MNKISAQAVVVVSACALAAVCVYATGSLWGLLGLIALSAL